MELKYQDAWRPADAGRVEQVNNRCRYKDSSRAVTVRSVDQAPWQLRYCRRVVCQSIASAVTPGSSSATGGGPAARSSLNMATGWSLPEDSGKR